MNLFYPYTNNIKCSSQNNYNNNGIVRNQNLTVSLNKNQNFQSYVQSYPMHNNQNFPTYPIQSDSMYNNQNFQPYSSDYFLINSILIEWYRSQEQKKIIEEYNKKLTEQTKEIEKAKQTICRLLKEMGKRKNKINDISIAEQNKKQKQLIILQKKENKEIEEYNKKIEKYNKKIEKENKEIEEKKQVRLRLLKDKTKQNLEKKKKKEDLTLLQKRSIKENLTCVLFHNQNYKKNHQ